jgi:hypothetical protein
MSVAMFDAPSGIPRRRAVDEQDFIAVILVGYGEKSDQLNPLYHPLC